MVFYLKEMSPEEADEKYENVMRQRHMFIYKKEVPALACCCMQDLQTSCICGWALPS